jgi:glycosyltransferase involved in cell wall biosynthesis
VVTRQETPAPPGVERRDGFDVVRLPRSPVPGWRALSDLLRIGRAVEALQPRPDVLLCFQTFISGFAGARLKRNLAIPLIVWIRGEGEYRMHGSIRNRLIGPGVWRAADGVLVQTDGNRVALLEEIERHAPASRAAVAAHLEVVPNGLDLPSTVTPPADGAPVLAVGRLIPEKGMHTVIEAVAAVRGRLVIAGDGPERGALEALARARGLEVRFEGFVGRERLAELYRECACVVLASARGEGLPNVLLESMANGRPVISTRVTGVRDLVVDGVNGLLVAPADAPALQAALTRLARDPELWRRLSEGARRTAQEFAWERVRPRLDAALAKLVP